MASVTCGLTAEDRDQLRKPTLVSSMGLHLPYLSRKLISRLYSLTEIVPEMTRDRAMVIGY